VEDLSDREYCILERLGRARWQGEIQTVLNTIVFKYLLPLIAQTKSMLYFIMIKRCSQLPFSQGPFTVACNAQ